MMEKRKNIICTVGPASQSLEVLRQMYENGMRVVRLNFSHGQYDDHLNVIRNIERLKNEGCAIKILQDLEGPRIRIGYLEGGRKKKLRKGDRLVLKNDDHKEALASDSIIYIDFTLSFQSIEEGMENLCR